MFMFIGNSNSVAYERKRANFTKKEFLLFRFFILHQGCKAINYDDLVQFIWGKQAPGITLNTVSQLAHRVRGKLNEIKAPINIIISRKNSCQILFLKKLIIVVLGSKFFDFNIYFPRKYYLKSKLLA